MNKVPNLRFSEFSGEWDRKRLSEVATIKGGYAFKSKEFLNSKSTYQVIKMGNLYQNQLLLDKSPSYKSEITGKEEEYLLKLGDIIITLTGTVGKKDFGYSYRITSEENLLLNQRLGLIRNLKNISDNRFLKYTVLGKVFLDQFFESSVGGTGNQANVSTKNMEQFYIYIPKLEEQEKIASFFSLIDKKIELQTEKVEELKNYKKGLMQKIFSQELRFKDENGNEYPEWEECKVKDLFDVTRGVVIAKSEISDTSNDIFKYAVYSSQTSNNGILGYDQTFDFDGNYLTWTTDGANAGRVFCRSGRFRCTNVCGVLVEKNNTIGYANKLVAEILNKETPKHVSYVGNPKLMNGVMAEIKLNIPSLEEQTKIDKLINQLDIKIESEQTKLNLLDDYKKGLLQQMFI